jgi:predicted DNA-binding transcriptional regulator AlpA
VSIADLKILKAEDLAPLLGRAASTIKTDVRRRPESLPPRLKIPGSNRVQWLEADVIEWIEEQRKASKQRK